MHDDTSPIRFNPGKQGYYRDDSKTKPTGSSGGKDFGKIMSQGEREDKSGKKGIKTDEDAPEENAEDIALLGEETAPQGPVSLFDISKSQNARLPKPIVKGNKGKSSETVASSGRGPETPASIMGGSKAKKSEDNLDVGDEGADEVAIEPDHIGDAVIQPKRSEQPSRPFDLLAAASREMTPEIEKTPSQKGKSAAQFGREQPDLAAVNPMAIAQSANAEVSVNLNTKADAPVLPVKSMQELINQMVKEVQSMEAQGKTDTTVTLKHPPLFEGAKLILTSFDSAKGEFNIAFENLSAAAQQIISMRENKESLLHALEVKGYHVHIVTASTIDEQRLFTANVEDNKRERNREDEEQQGRGREQRQDEE